MKKVTFKDRADNAINAGSMADIAFLLLIFFLVTTTIDSEKGLLVLLPPWEDSVSPPMPITQRNLFTILVNGNNELLVRGQITNIESLRTKTKEFIANPKRDITLAEKPNRAVIALQNDRSTSYESYVMVYNEIKAAYNELHDELAQQQYNRPYQYCTSEQKKKIRNLIPVVVSESEPTDYHK